MYLHDFFLRIMPNMTLQNTSSSAYTNADPALAQRSANIISSCTLTFAISSINVPDYRNKLCQILTFETQKT